MQPVVALVDCNNFYASCERVFNPGIARTPIVVLSNNDGCVVARSNEAKALGIPAGIPAFKIKHLIRSGEVYACSSNYSLYGDLSQRVMDTLAQFTPEMEIYSIDEAFLNLTGLVQGDLAAYGRTICATVRQWTGIPVSIGIAETKVLAKIAGRLAKKSPKARGILNLTGSPHRERALAVTPIEEVWGIGRRYAKFLRMRGIETALDLHNAEDSWVKRHLTVVGLRLVRELRGEPCLSLELSPPAKKEICVSRSFGTYVTTLDGMREAVATYVMRAAEKLRKQCSAAGTVMVFMMTNRFRDETQYAESTVTELPVPSDCTEELIHYALRGVERIYRPGFRFNKAGVVFAGLVPSNQVQTDLFDTKDRDRAGRLMQALDTVNARLGPGTLTYAVAGVKQPWRTKFMKRSPRYTTRWSELAEVVV